MISPIRQLRTRVGLLREDLEELVHRVSHVDDGDLARVVPGGTHATELRKVSMGGSVRAEGRTYVLQHLRKWASSAVSITKYKQ